jgi:hypothetical protein
MNDTTTSTTMTDTKRRVLHLRVPVFPDEEQSIKDQATTAGLSIAAYLRAVGLGYEIKGIVDHQQVEKLARINGDLGRLGGLLKLWLTKDERLAQFDPDQMRQTIHLVLDKIATSQTALQEAMQTVVRQ